LKDSKRTKRFVAQITLENGRKKKTYHATEKEAIAARRKMLNECKIREETQQESGLKTSITEVYSTVLNSLWRQRGCYVIWNGQPFTT
jgi:hypothetical protein